MHPSETGDAMKEPDAIEIKVNIGGNVDRALTALGLDGGKARQVWFLDDLTEAPEHHCRC